MSFRYKSALLSLLSMTVIYGWYFATVIGRPGAGHDHGRFGQLLLTILFLVAVQIVGHIVIAGTSADRYRHKDEREQGIDRRATTVGYYLLVAGALGAAATIGFGVHAVTVANAILLAIVLAECARQAAFLLLHHRPA